jgi:hypothetical protein
MLTSGNVEMPGIEKWKNTKILQKKRILAANRIY